MLGQRNKDISKNKHALFCEREASHVVLVTCNKQLLRSCFPPPSATTTPLSSLLLLLLPLPVLSNSSNNNTLLTTWLSSIGVSLNL
jgi:hypothetical protein